MIHMVCSCNMDNYSLVPFSNYSLVPFSRQTKPKNLNFCHKLRFLNPYIMANQWRRLKQFQTIKYVCFNNLSLDYQRFTPTGCKDIVVKNLSLWQKLNSFHIRMKIHVFLMKTPRYWVEQKCFEYLKMNLFFLFLCLKSKPEDLQGHTSY